MIERLGFGNLKNLVDVDTVLAYMALNHRDRFGTLLGYLQQIIPSFRDLKFIRTPLHRRETELIRFGDEGVKRETKRKYVGTALLLDFDHVQGIEASGCSDGTLLARATTIVLIDLHGQLIDRILTIVGGQS